MDAELANELLKGVHEITDSKPTKSNDEELKGLYGVDSPTELEEAIENDNTD